MKEIILNRGYIAQVDDSDYEWLIKYKWRVSVTTHNCYATRWVIGAGGKYTKMHRDILGVTDPKIFIDHIDHNGLNNQKSNLRIATHSQNASNGRPRKNSTSRYLGVSWRPKSQTWIAQIEKGGRRGRRGKFLGLYKSENEAALAYNEAANIIHGEFANLNVIK